MELWKREIVFTVGDTKTSFHSRTSYVNDLWNAITGTDFKHSHLQIKMSNDKLFI